MSARWIHQSPYCIKAKWTPEEQSGVESMDLVADEGLTGMNPASSVQGGTNVVKPVVIVLTLYKVQQGIYLLDFHKLQGELLTFIGLCSSIINELKLHAARVQLQKRLSEQGGGR